MPQFGHGRFPDVTGRSDHNPSRVPKEPGLAERHAGESERGDRRGSEPLCDNSDCLPGGSAAIRRRPSGLLHEPVKRVSVSKIAASVQLIPIWRPWNILILLKENTMASRRNDNGKKNSQPDLLQPLPPEERPATIGSDEIGRLLASVEELKVPIVERSGPDEANNPVIQEAMNGFIEEFRNRQRERSELNSSILELVQKALINNQETLTNLLSEPGRVDGKAGPAVAETLEPLIGIIEEGFRNIQERHIELLKTHSESNRGIVEALGQVQVRPAPATVSLEALDNWRDDCIKRLEAAGGTRLSIGEIEAELDRIDRVSGRMTMLMDEFEKLKIEITDGFANFTTIPNDHGTRIDELKAFLKRNSDAVSWLSGEFRKNSREFRLWRLAWVSPLVLLMGLSH